MIIRSTAPSLALIAVTSTLAGAGPTLRGLGEPPGATAGSVPQAVSADGSVVVGYASGRPTRWTASTGNRAMPMLPGATSSDATGVSADGSIIVGRSSHPTGYRACRWTMEGTVVEDLSDTPGRVTIGWVNAVSADGSVIVGQGYEEWQGARAFRMTGTTPPISLGMLAPVQGSSEAIDVSADGSVVVGWSHNSSFNGEAFRWTSETGMVGLGMGPIPFTSYSYTRAVSADGSTIVGYLIAERNTAFRWTAVAGITPLQPALGHTYSYAFAVNGDGSVLGGQLSGGLGAPVRAALWDTTHGWRYLENVLIDADIGSQLDGWELETVMAMSPGGRFLVGVGRHLGQRPRAWIVDFGAPCAADLNQDGLVDFSDYLDFLTLFDAGDLRVDFTGDGIVDFADYLEFLNLYDLGC